MDMGVNIDAHGAHPLGEKLAFNLTVDVNTFGANPNVNQHSENPAATTPVTRQNKWQGAVIIPLNKPTVVFSSDLPDTKGAMQVMVTAKQLE